ncbi:MAG: alpha/beta hydrolase family protein, partial [Candidatus Acidiferrales bacterium]
SDGHIAGLHFAPGSEAAAAEWSAPDYANASKFHEEKVTVGDGQWQLPGTLTLPNAKGPFAAVVLVSGSGPEDEDETIGPNKPLKDLAWGLATRGIAVLRYTKRTKQYGAASTGDSKNFTVKDEYIDDARAAVALLASRSDIDAKHIFVAGHSEGGYIAPRIAAGDSQIAGIIILEGNTRPIERLVIEQLHYQANLRGPNAAQIEKVIPQAEEEAKVIESQDLKPGMEVNLLGAMVPASYFLDLRGYDPTAAATKLNIPIFVVQGGRDYQVTTTDFAGWQKALAGHSNTKLKLYPALNHLLIAGTGSSTPEEYMKLGHVSGEVIDDVAAWIQAQTTGISRN